MNAMCWLTRRRLGAYQDGELPPSARVKVQAHLDGCRGCAADLAALGRLRTALTVEASELPEAVWQAFWPQVRARLAPLPAPEPYWRRAWSEVVGHPRLALGSALAAGALALLAVVAPWQQLGPGSNDRATLPVAQAPSVAPAGPAPSAPIQQVLVESVETADPQSSVMVFTNPESDVTIVWVFGLERTDI